MESLNACPICNSSKFLPFLRCKDYTVSRETFSIVQCESCGFRFTNPRPEESQLGEYYKSEEYVSHSNSNKGLINSLYQRVRKYTLGKKLKLIKRFKNTGSILDIGCGTGEFLNTCKLAGWETIGIEPSEEARGQAVKNYQLEVKEESFLSQLPPESFDVITMWHVLEHVPRLNERIGDLKRLVKPGGRIIVAVPNCASKDAVMYGENWAAYDVPRHLYHFRPDDIERLFKKFSMTVEEILPMKFDSFYVSMLSEKNQSGNPKPVKAFWNGLRSNLSASGNGKTYSSQIYIIKPS